MTKEHRAKLEKLNYVYSYDEVNKTIDVPQGNDKLMEEASRCPLLTYLRAHQGYSVRYVIPDAPKAAVVKCTPHAEVIETPDWVKWEAVDKTGEKWGFSHKPVCDKKNGWWKIDPKKYPKEKVRSIMYELSDSFCDDWQETLVAV